MLRGRSILFTNLFPKKIQDILARSGLICLAFEIAAFRPQETLYNKKDAKPAFPYGGGQGKAFIMPWRKLGTKKPFIPKG